MKHIIAMAIVLIAALTVFTVNAFNLAFYVNKDGYVIESGDIYSSLSSSNQLNIKEVSENDAIFERSGNYYLNKTNFEFSKDYPIVYKGLNVIGFFNDSAMLIANDFYQLPTYDELMVASGISFNSDFTQADLEEFILVRLVDNSYINTQLVKIETPLKTVYINNNSFILFEDDKVTYEYINDDQVIRGSIENLLQATISIGQNKYNYTDFIEYLAQAIEDYNFTIRDDEIQKDETMPKVSPLVDGEAKLTFDSNGNLVIDKTTVESTGLDTSASKTETEMGDSEGEKGDDKGDEDGLGGEGSLKEGSSQDAQSGKESANKGENAGAEVIEQQDNTSKTDKDDDAATDDSTHDDAEEQEGMSREPEVTITEFTPWVYTAGGSARIYDFSSRMIGNLKFIVTNSEGKSITRKSVSSTGQVVLTGLPPDTDLTITASYRYYDNDGNKRTTGADGIPVLFTQKIHTLKQELVPAFDVEYTPSEEVYPHYVVFKDVTLKNPSEYSQITDAFEKSKYNSTSFIASANIVATSKKDGTVITMPIATSNLNRLKQGKTIDIQSNSSLNSNTEYTYKIEFFDKFENKLTTNPADLSGSFKTDKISPSTMFNLLVNEAGNIRFTIDITDGDEAIVNNTDKNCKYYLRVKNEDGNYTTVRANITGNTFKGIKYSKEICLDDLNIDITLLNLPFNKYLTIELVADVDLNNNQGLQEDVVIGSYSFFSSGVVSGSLNYNTVFGNLGGTFATAIVNLTPSSNSSLANLLTDIEFTITSSTNKSFSFNLKKDSIQEISEANGNLNYIDGGVTIQEANAETNTIGVRVIGKYTLFAEDLWQAILTGVTSGEDYCTIEIEFPKGSLDPSTLYTMSIRSLIDQGDTFYSIETVNKNNQFSTLKREPEIHYESMDLINNSLIFSGLYITDIDETIIAEPIVMELVWDDIVISTQTINVGEVKDSIVFDDLMDNESYTIRFKAKEYNNGLTQATYYRNKVFDSINFTANSSITGSLEVSEMTMKPYYYCQDESSEYYGENLLDSSKNMINNITLTQGAYVYYNDNIVSDSTYFYSDYIALDPNLAKTLFIWQFAGSSWYGENPDGTYHSGKPNKHIVYYHYDEEKGTYKRLGYASYYLAGDYLDLTTLSYADQITHIRLNGICGFEKSCQLYQGVEPISEIDPFDYQEYWKSESILNGYGQLTSSSSYTTLDYNVPVNEGEIYYTRIDSGNIHTIAFYDEKGLVVQANRYYNGSGYLDYGASDGFLTVIPNNATSMKISYNTSYLNNEKYRTTVIAYKLAETNIDDGNSTYYTKVKVNLGDGKGVLPVGSKFKIKALASTTELNRENSLAEFTEEKVYTFINEGDEKQTTWNYGFNYEVISDKYYSFKLYLVLPSGKEYLLDTENFNSDTDWEYIYNFTDFDKIYENEFGKFKVMADIVVPQTGDFSNYRRVVNGVLDFNGHTIYLRNNSLLFDVGPSGTIKNVVVDYSFPGNTTRSVKYANFVYNNYGTISNVICRYPSILSIDMYTDYYGWFVHYNQVSGVIENVAILIDNIITFNPSTYDNNRHFSFGVYSNYGLIRNSYIATTNSNAKVYSSYSSSNSYYSRFGAFCYYNEAAGIIENCYSLMSIWQKQGADISKYTSSFVWSNAGKVYNSFAVGDRPTYILQGANIMSSANQTEGYIPAVCNDQPQNYINSYMFTNPNPYLTFSNAIYSGINKGDSKNLAVSDWYTDTLGLSEDDFDIYNCVSAGYYPRLNFPSNMQKNQPYLEITNYSEYDGSLRVINTEITEQKENTAKAKIYLNNPSGYNINKVIVENLECNISNITFDSEHGYTVLEVSLGQPTKFVSSYNITSIEYQLGTAPVTANVSNATIDCEFYRSISSVEGWQLVIADPSQNYRLTNDIDFSGMAGVAAEKMMVVTRNFTGKLDGTKYDVNGNVIGTYALKNIQLGETYGYMINSLYGTISNLTVRNLNILENTKRNQWVGFVREMYNKNCMIDNVHILNSSIKGVSFIGGIVGYCSYGTIKNSSFTYYDDGTTQMQKDGSATISDYKLSIASNNTAYVGGICGYARYANFENCFVSGISINVSCIKNVNGVGGIVGECEHCKINNTYAYGSISNYANRTGGIAGYVYNCQIKSSYTNMRLEGTDIIGGITGYDYNCSTTSYKSTTDYENLFVMGNIYCKASDYNEIHRLFGTHNLYGENIYAFENQVVSPLPSGTTLDATDTSKTLYSTYLDDATGIIKNVDLSSVDIFRYKIGLSNEFNLEPLSSRILPTLKNSETGEELPYQTEIYLAVEGVSTEVQRAYESTELDKVYYYVEYVVKHPEGYIVDKDSVNISDMKIVNEDGYLSVDVSYNDDRTEEVITIKCTKERALDGYMLTCNLVSTDTTSSFKQQLSSPVTFNTQIFWTISNYDQWKSIMQEHGDGNENFKIIGKIDFNEDNPAKYDLVINKLVGGTDTAEITNFNLTATTDTGYVSFISTISSYINNIKFSDITIDYTAVTNNTSFAGVLGSVSEMNNVTLENIQITAANYSSSNYLGAIGKVTGNVTGLKATNVNYTQQAYSSTRTSTNSYIGVIGGLGGSIHNSDFINCNILGDQLYSNYVGCIGYYMANYISFEPINTETTWDPTYQNVKLDSYSMRVDGCVVKGHTYVGGAIGYGTYNQLGTVLRALDRITVNNVDVTGYSYVGCYEGNGNASNKNVKLTNSKVDGDYNVGGFVACMGNALYDFEIDNVSVTGGYCVGTLGGIGGGYYYGGTITNVDVTGGCNVGGLSGYRSGYNLYYDIYMENVTVTGTDTNSEGIALTEIYDTTQATKDGFVLNGDNVGGIQGCGSDTNTYSIYLRNSTVKNVTVTGHDNVGGLYGNTRSYYSYYSEYQVTVSGNENVGGIIGYLKDGLAYWQNFKQIYVDATVSGANNVAAIAGYMETEADYGFNNNGDSSHKNQSVVLNVSLEVTGKTTDSGVESYISYYANTSDKVYLTPKAGSIDALKYLETCEMKKYGESSYSTITKSDLPILYVYGDPSTLSNFQPEILKLEDMMDYYKLYSSQQYNNQLGLDTSYFIYNEDFLMEDNDLEIARTSKSVIEVSGLEAGSHTATLTLSGEEKDNDGLLLYYDATNNVGTGTSDKSSTIWKNLGSLGSDYDLTISENPNKSDNAARWSWSDNSLHIKEKRMAKDKDYADQCYADVKLETDHVEGRLDMTDSAEYTISATYKMTYRGYIEFDLFGTYIDFTDNDNGTKKYNLMGPTLRQRQTNTYLLTWGGNWNNNWTSYTHYPISSDNENYGKYPYLNDVVNVTISFDHITKNIYYMRYYINGVNVYNTTWSLDLGGNNNYQKDITDGWVHMLCHPTVTVKDGIENVTYSYHSFAGDIYSVRMYDHALDSYEVEDLYEDEMSKYSTNNAKASTVETVNITADANGKAVITLPESFAGKSGNLTVQIGNNTSVLNNLDLSANYDGSLTVNEVVGSTVRSATDVTTTTTKTALTGYYFEDKTLELTVNDESAKWYRTKSNGYARLSDDYEIYDGKEVGVGATLYTNMAGYYYAKTSAGYTSIIHLDNPITVMQLYRVTNYSATKDGIVKNSEGEDEYGNFNSTTDELINGGIEIKGYTHPKLASLFTSFFTTFSNFFNPELPEVYVYSSSADTVNIELAEECDEDIYVTVKADNETVIETILNSSNRTVTMAYDYQTQFKVEWNNGVNSSNASYDAIDLRNSISTYGDNYYYLTSNNVLTNTGSVDVLATHIYNNEAINYDGEIVNLDDGSIRLARDNWTIVSDKPLFVFDYNDQTIQTYYAYSLVDDEIINQQIIVKNGKAHYLDPSYSSKASGIVVDEDDYEKSILNVLYDNEIVKLGLISLEYPDEFDNSDIREISCSVESNSSIILVRYYNGTIVGFDYKTGEELELISQLQVDFITYLATPLRSMMKLTSRTGALQSAYATAMSDIQALDDSNNAQVVELFSAYKSTNEEVDPKAQEVGLMIHDTSVGLKYNEETEEFEIVPISGNTKAATGELAYADGEANGDGSGKNLQDEIDEIAQNNNIPGLSRGMVSKTRVNSSTNTVVNTIFGLILVVSLGAAIAIVVSKKGKGGLI